MQLGSFFKNFSNSTKPTPMGPAMNFAEVTKHLLSLSPAELAKAYDAAVARSTAGRIPMTIHAMSKLNWSSTYMRNGEICNYCRVADPFKSAAQFVRFRSERVELPRVRAAKKQVVWARDVMDPAPSPEFLAKARRNAHA